MSILPCIHASHETLHASQQSMPHAEGHVCLRLPLSEARLPEALRSGSVSACMFTATRVYNGMVPEISM